MWLKVHDWKRTIKEGTRRKGLKDPPHLTSVSLKWHTQKESLTVNTRWREKKKKKDAGEKWRRESFKKNTLKQQKSLLILQKKLPAAQENLSVTHSHTRSSFFLCRLILPFLLSRDLQSSAAAVVCVCRVFTVCVCVCVYPRVCMLQDPLEWAVAL